MKNNTCPNGWMTNLVPSIVKLTNRGEKILFPSEHPIDSLVCEWLFLTKGSYEKVLRKILVGLTTCCFSTTTGFFMLKVNKNSTFPYFMNEHIFGPPRWKNGTKRGWEYIMLLWKPRTYFWMVSSGYFLTKCFFIKIYYPRNFLVVYLTIWCCSTTKNAVVVFGASIKWKITRLTIGSMINLVVSPPLL